MIGCGQLSEDVLLARFGHRVPANADRSPWLWLSASGASRLGIQRRQGRQSARAFRVRSGSAGLTASTAGSRSFCATPPPPSLPRPLKSYTRRRREFLATPAKEREVWQ